MEREVVVVDAVYYNLALLLESHRRTRKGRVRILYNAVSDKSGQLLYPYLEEKYRERGWAGATYLVSKEDLDSGKER